MISAQNKQKLAQEIDNRLKELETNIKHLEKECLPIEPECALGDLGRFELMHDQHVYEQNLQQAKLQRTQLQFALSKIDDEGFGICLSCDEPIDMERLLLLPHSPYCISCASSM